MFRGESRGQHVALARCYNVGLFTGPMSWLLGLSRSSGRAGNAQSCELKLPSHTSHQFIMKRLFVTLSICLFAITMRAQAEDATSSAPTAASPVLFNGETLAGWHVSPEKLSGQWTVVNGMIVGDNSDKKGSILWTDADYGDFELTLEYRTDSPDYDSGVFLHGESHQVQIGISRSLKVDLTACIYAPVDKQGSYPAKSDKVKTVHKLGEWNELRMIVTGKRIQTFLNDEPFVDYTAIKFPAEGKIGLQLHQGVHQKMLFRNIELTAK
ncbi:hypothetical protein Poly21_16630 [Allorhodopirellula heiligendammensis]|uniref:3-keto-alpha-glucoside-1,2-lyase/3-keto-2-hydroxy-glucal hydratase domain-containing protein n=2 Tax=Allorhodopirellula heiligendammensis TaxID=2714739 RepID=A0A5C6C4F4_9BACT|nr:hypothetical protein Poly21_16630 [Allorhodopirellula heiligendammensis]